VALLVSGLVATLIPISLEGESDEGFHAAAGASWELRVCLARDPVTGSKRYRTQTVRGGKREAQTALAEMITEAKRGLTVRTRATVGELLEASRRALPRALGFAALFSVGTGCGSRIRCGCG
jgi:hypothetical protein